MRLIFMDTTLNFFLSEGITEQEINSLIEGGKLMQYNENRYYFKIEENNE